MLYEKASNEIYDGEMILDNLIQKIVEQSSVIRFSNNDLQYLYQATAVFSKVFYSKSSPGLGRMESLYLEILNAKVDHLKGFSKVILLFMYSNRHPLIMNELGPASDIISCFSESTEIKWGLGIDDSLGSRLALYMICSK